VLIIRRLVRQVSLKGVTTLRPKKLTLQTARSAELNRIIGVNTRVGAAAVLARLCEFSRGAAAEGSGRKRLEVSHVYSDYFFPTH
jgi:hypothetical protein